MHKTICDRCGADAPPRPVDVMNGLDGTGPQRYENPAEGLMLKFAVHTHAGTGDVIDLCRVCVAKAFFGDLITKDGKLLICNVDGGANRVADDAELGALLRQMPFSAQLGRFDQARKPQEYWSLVYRGVEDQDRDPGALIQRLMRHLNPKEGADAQEASATA